MFSKAKILMVALAAAVVSPAAATATTVNYDLVKNTAYSIAQVILPNGDVEFAFTVKQPLKIAEFALTASTAGDTVTEAVDDLDHIRFGFTVPPVDQFSTLVPYFNTAIGFGTLPGGSYARNDTFSIFVTDGIENPVGLTLSFQTAAIPVPAAGLMLAPVLLAGGVVALRRRKAALAAV